MADDAKSFLGLVNGIARRTYYGEGELSDEFLKNELYPNLSENDFSHLILKCTNVIKSMASADMDLNQLEAYLTSQTKKKEGGLTEEQTKVLAKFWKIHKSRIHDSIISQTTWGNKLKNVTWRIDIKTQARHIDQINTPTAIMELQVTDNATNNKDTDVVRFEMDEQKLEKVLENMQEIEEEIKKYCQQ